MGATGDVISAVVPLTATDQPKLKFEVPSSGSSFCTCVHASPERANTYTAPSPPLPPIVAYGAPITSVSPDTATENPNPSNAAPSSALSSCCRVQTPSTST